MTRTFSEVLGTVPKTEMRPLAESVGCSWDYLVRIQRGLAVPYPTLAGRLAEALGECPVEWGYISRCMSFPEKVQTIPVEIGKRMAKDMRPLFPEQVANALGWSEDLTDAYLSGDSIMGSTDARAFCKLVGGDAEWYLDRLDAGEPEEPWPREESRMLSEH